MIVTQIIQQFRMACDHCGKEAKGWQVKIDAARLTAKLEDKFHSQEWTMGSCIRELWLCRDCYNQALVNGSGTGVVKPDLVTDLR